MDITRIENAPVPLPFPIYASILIARAQNRDGELFSIVRGLDESLVGELKRLSLDASDTELDANTSDRKRFGEGSYEIWFKKGRVPFALVHEETGKLAALAWFGSLPLGQKSVKYLSEEELKKTSSREAGNWHTLSFRSYAPFRGKGLMKDFVRFCINEYKHYVPDAKLWVILQAGNTGSGALAKSLGFEVEEGVTEGSVVMVQK